MIEMPHDLVIDVEKFFKYLNEKPEVYIDINLIKKDMDSLKSQLRSRVEQVKDMFYSVVGFIPDELTRYVLFKYLENNHVPKKLYQAKSSKKDTPSTDSLSSKSLAVLVAEEYCVDFCTMYMNLQSRKYYISKINMLLSAVKNESMFLGNEGEDLIRVPYEINRISNRRFSTANQNVIGFYGTLRSSLKSKKGYVLVSGDFPQIDGRGALNLYLKTNLMKRIVKNTNDSYLAFRELVRHTENEYNKFLLKKRLSSPDFVETRQLENLINNFDNSVQPFSSEEERTVYKVISLQSVYNSQSSPFKHISYQIKRLHNTLTYTGRYRLMSELAEYFRQIGYPIVTRSRWGASEVISEVTAFRVLSKLFNTPIQTTSSEIISHFVNCLMDSFRKLGYDKDDIRVYVNRHDEPIFEVKEEVFWKHARIFKEASYILIHGWSPFEIKWKIGYAYGDHDNKFTDYLKSLSYDKTEWYKRAEEHIDDEEPLTLDVPEIAGLSYRFTPNGHLLIILTRQLGSYPMNEFYFDKYRDSRKIEYTLIRSKIDIENIDEYMLLSFVSKLINDLPKDRTIIVNLGDNSKSRSYTLGEHSVFLTGYPHKLLTINKIILGNIIVDNYIDVATPEDKNYSSYASFYKDRLVRRVI